MKPKYCYWSVCDGAYAGLMENCVRSAREAGVFKEFHVLTDRPIEGCECYDCYQFEKAYGLFKLHYLKVGMSRLNFDYFIWLDADTVFVLNPVDPLGALGRSPIHVPLEELLPETEREEKDDALGRVGKLMRQEGIAKPYLCQSAFWIIHHDAIEPVYELALGFWHKAKEGGVCVDVSGALGYAMQLLCANPEAHLLEKRDDLWASDDAGLFRERQPDGSRWSWHSPVSRRVVEVQPALMHLPWNKELPRSALV